MCTKQRLQQQNKANKQTNKTTKKRSDVLNQITAVSPEVQILAWSPVWNQYENERTDQEALIKNRLLAQLASGDNHKLSGSQFKGHARAQSNFC